MQERTIEAFPAVSYFHRFNLDKMDRVISAAVLPSA